MSEEPTQYTFTRDQVVDAGMSNWIIDASRRDLEQMIHSQQREIKRLRRLHAARPPYKMPEWEPADLASLLERDTDILRSVQGDDERSL